jgi:hypothetical protein
VAFAQLLGVLHELGLLGGHPGDLLRAVDAHAGGHVAQHLGDRVAQDLDLAGHGVGQLGALAQVGSSTAADSSVMAIEERADDRGVAVVGRAGERGVGRGARRRIGVDVGPDLIERAEVGESVGEGALHLAALGLHLGRKVSTASSVAARVSS